MKANERISSIPAAVYALCVFAVTLLTACNQDRLAGCEGDIVVENEIPDLVMHLDDEPFRRDVIYDKPVVFRHTAGESNWYHAQKS